MATLKELSELALLSLYGIHKQKEKSRLQGGKYVFLKREEQVGFGVAWHRPKPWLHRHSCVTLDKSPNHPCTSFHRAKGE